MVHFRLTYSNNKKKRENFVNVGTYAEINIVLCNIYIYIYIYKSLYRVKRMA